ncbi:MAG: autotransporter outer membrane beta-barrel domain-containing protein, partial [Synergistaceae bacterium]|nr:autotransporter outer membrane beta-barrel domain-containing protein [Synergistaceae bacterium]
AINVNIDGTSTWNVTADSTPDGVLNNAGTVNFGSNAADGFKQVRVSDYNGDPATSKLLMKTDINSASNTDQIYATNQATGGSSVTIYNTANSGVERSQALLLADNGGGSNLTLANYDEETGGVKYLHAGAWKYSLVKSTTGASGEEWYLKRGDKITPDTPPDKGLTTTGEAIAAGAFLHDVWYTETNTWNSRMGIYRDKTWNGGLWISAAANREDFDQIHDNTLADRQDFATGTIGYDKKFKVKGGDFWGGVMAGYGETDSSLVAGIGDADMKSYHMSLYGIYRMENGFYINGILKFNEYDSELTVNKPDNFTRYVLGYDQVKGDWRQYGLGISLQTGKRFDIGENGWYWEPQMQFSWNRVFGTSYKTDSGIAVDIDDIDYIRLRGGIVLGRSWTLQNDTLLDLYADASIIHDFDADTRVTMSGGAYTSTLGGTWGVYGIGANWRYRPGKFFHVRFQYSNGEPFVEPFAVYLGMSWEM